MHTEIIKLLEKATQKGVLLFNDKKEILKKGIDLGIDKYELEMYIENYQFSKPENETKKCPYCNANIPFLSNVCSFCGKELKNKSKISDDELIVNINKNIETIDKLRTPSLSEFLLKYAIIFFVFISVVTILVTLIFLPGTISLRVIIYIILGVISFWRYKNNNYASPDLNKILNNTISIFEKNQNLFKLYYSNNREIQELTEKFNNKVNIVKTNIKTITTKALIIYTLAFIGLFGFSLIKSTKNDYNYLKENDINIVELFVKDALIEDEYKENIKIQNTDYKLVVKQDKLGNSTIKYLAVIKITLKIPDNQANNFYFEDFSLTFVDKRNKTIEHTRVFKTNEKLFKKGEKTFEFYCLFQNISNINEYIREIKKGSSIIINASKKDFIVKNSMNNEEGEFKDNRDGYVYKTIKIGDQTWFSENLNYNAGYGCWVYDNYDEASRKLGRLYNYKTAVKSCPKGWHLPTDDEWAILINYLGGEDVAGKKLKSFFGWLDYEGKNLGDNASGFSAIPAGCRRSDDKGDEFINSIHYSYWWTATTIGKNSAWIRFLDSSAKVDRQKAVNKFYAYSVRCIKNK